MSTLWLPALVLPLFLGYGLMSMVYPGTRGLRAALGLGAGPGLVSLFFYLVTIVFGHADGRVFIWFEVVCLIGLTLWWFLARSSLQVNGFERKPWTRQDKLLGGVFLLAAVFGLYLFFMISLDRPHGVWDAWWNWNMRARFLFRASAFWMDYLDVHTWATYEDVPKDYPLLLPICVARIWWWIGGDGVGAPIAVAFLFTAAAVGLTYAATAALRSRGQGLLAAALLVGTPNFIRIATYQLADVPLSYFFLAALVPFCLMDNASTDRRSLSRLAILAGFMAGLVCWTKNEGLMFLPALILARSAVLLITGQWRRWPREAFFFCLGLVPVLVFLVHFKLTVSLASHLLEGQTPAAMVEKWMDISRHIKIITRLLSLMGPMILLVVYLALVRVKAGVLKQPGFLTGVFTVGLTLAGYYFIYVITPIPLDFSLGVSSERLVLHFWPSVIFLFFLLAEEPVIKKHPATVV